MLELTLALHTLRAIQSIQCHCRHRALAQRQACLGGNRTPSGCEYGSRGCCWGVVVLLSSATAGSTDTQGGHNRRSIQDNIFAALQLQQTTAPSSPVAVTDSSEHSSPHAHSKSQISQRAGAGGDGTERVVESLSGGVETLLSIAHIPFGPFVLPSALLLCIFRGHTRIPHASRQPCLYHHRVTTHKLGSQVGSLHDTILPNFGLAACLTRALLLRCILYYPPQCHGKSVT